MKMIEFIKGAIGEIAFSLRCLCGKPSPVKQFIMVAVAGSALGIASFCILVNSIYHIGYTHAKKEIPELNFIRQLNLKNDSIHLLKQKVYEYEQEREHEQ